MNLQLKQLRKSRGLTQAQLAESVGTTMRVMSSWERSETSLPLEDAARIADVLQCTLDELAGREWHGEGFADPQKEKLVSCYDKMNESGRTLLVESAKSISADPARRIVKDGPQHMDDTRILSA